MHSNEITVKSNLTSRSDLEKDLVRGQIGDGSVKLLVWFYAQTLEQLVSIDHARAKQHSVEAPGSNTPVEASQALLTYKLLGNMAETGFDIALLPDGHLQTQT